MNIVLTTVLAIQMLSAVCMIGLVLVQHGKGADMGAAFGSGGSGSLFGASGSANFLSRTTGILAAVFFACTLLLAYFSNVQPRTSSSVLDASPIVLPQPSPATPGMVQIPTVPSVTPNTTTGSMLPASGAGQIPTK